MALLSVSREVGMKCPYCFREEGFVGVWTKDKSYLSVRCRKCKKTTRVSADVTYEEEKMSMAAYIVGSLSENEKKEVELRAYKMLDNDELSESCADLNDKESSSGSVTGDEKEASAEQSITAWSDSESSTGTEESGLPLFEDLVDLGNKENRKRAGNFTPVRTEKRRSRSVHMEEADADEMGWLSEKEKKLMEEIQAMRVDHEAIMREIAELRSILGDVIDQLRMERMALQTENLMLRDENRKLAEKLHATVEKLTDNVVETMNNSIKKNVDTESGVKSPVEKLKQDSRPAPSYAKIASSNLGRAARMRMKVVKAIGDENTTLVDALSSLADDRYRPWRTPKLYKQFFLQGVRKMKYSELSKLFSKAGFPLLHLIGLQWRGIYLHAIVVEEGVELFQKTILAAGVVRNITDKWIWGDVKRIHPATIQ